MTLNSNDNKSPDAERVLTGAVVIAADELALSDAEMAKLFEMPVARVQDFRNGNRRIQTEEKAWEPAILLVRLHQALTKIVGPGSIYQQAWLNSFNQHFNSTPRVMLSEPNGLSELTSYLESQSVGPL